LTAALRGFGIKGIDMNDHDVYAYGVISASTLYLLKDSYPARSGYAEIATKYRNVGGEAANTSIVLSRLGKSVRLDGNWINPDEDAQHLQGVFNENRVDISRVSFRRCQGPKEMLVVDATSRTIFGTYAHLLEEKSWNLPQKRDVQNAKVICLDPFFGDASVKAANLAKGLGKPVVTVDCKYDNPMLLASEIAIISEEFLRDSYRSDSVPSITREYLKRSGGTVIFTFGHEEIIYGTREEGFRRFAPFAISPVDTTGAGDSFRAGIILGLLRKWPTEKMVEFAAALAAMVCQSFPGVLNSPSYGEVISFLKDHGSGERWADDR
jgi:sugar/nucleoside kinase (ribokinase family)